jgi:hypothetical protein
LAQKLRLCAFTAAGRAEEDESHKPFFRERLPEEYGEFNTKFILVEIYVPSKDRGSQKKTNPTPRKFGVGIFNGSHGLALGEAG